MFQRSFQRVFPNGFPTGTDPRKHTSQRVCDPTYILKYITAALFGQGADQQFPTNFKPNGTPICVFHKTRRSA
jgi:hypothetical protein